MKTDSLEKLFTVRGRNAADRLAFDAHAGWRYGLVFGSVFIVVAWGVDAAELFSESAALFWPKLLLAILLVLPFYVAAGALAARAHGSLLRMVLVWILFSALAGLVAMRIPFEGASAIAALVDPAVRGVTIFPFTSAVEERVVPVAIFCGVAGVIAAVLQALATHLAWDRSTTDNRMTLGGWASLLVCAPFAIALGAAVDGAANSQLRAPLYLTNRVVQLALHTPPDLNLQDMETLRLLDYLATSRWRTEFSEHFAMHLADFDHQTLRSGYVDVQFDNGFIWRCLTVRNGDNLGVCSDVRADYGAWMKDFFATGFMNCGECFLQVEPAVADWRAKTRAELSDPQKVDVTHHLGGVVMARITFASGKQAECRLVGADPVVVQQCTETQ